MKNRIWTSLLLAGALGISGGTSVWAHEGTGTESIEWEEQTPDQEAVSADAIDEPGSPQKEEVEKEDGSASENTLSESENKVPDVISEDKTVRKRVVSDDVVSADTMDVENETISDDQVIGETEKKPMEVILPADVSFEMMTVGEKKLEGMISSKQFCIENRGDEDVRITIQGKCQGKKEGEYVMTAASTTDEYVPGKKNVWLYLRWEDKDGEILDRPGIVIGDDSDPGVGEVILKAPKKDKNGEIEKSDRESKAYFSLTGDMRSDTDETWRDNELKLGLGVSMEICEDVDGND